MSFKILGKYEMRKFPNCPVFFPKNMCQPTSSDQSIVRNLTRKLIKWNNLLIEIRKEINRFKKITREMIKLQEPVPIDRQVQGFRNYFY